MKPSGNGAKTVTEYLNSVDPSRKKDIKTLHELIRKTLPTYKPHIMAGMLAYGQYHYKYTSGREGDWMNVALASQKNYISLYICALTSEGGYLAESYKVRLPKANIGKSCVRFKKLDDIDLKVIERLLKEVKTARLLTA